MKWQLWFVLVAALLLPTLGTLAASAPAMQQACSSVSAYHGEPGGWSLICNGKCAGDPPPACMPRTFTVGDDTYTGCGCEDGQPPPGNCCQVVLDGDGNPKKWGNCPACNTTGRCILVNDGTEAEAVCDE